jgi:uncharacterized protein (TIGR03067 family)
MKLSRSMATLACLTAAFVTRAAEPTTAPDPGAAPRPAAAELALLQGTWEGVVVGDGSQDKHTYTVTITGHSLHFHRDTNFWFETTITLPAGTDPRQLHATIRHSAPPEDSNGKLVVAIYKVEAGTLTLATRGGGTDETPQSFDTTAEQGLTCYALRKIQPRRKNAEPAAAKR